MAIDTPARMPATFKVPVEPIWQLRIEQYHQMIRTGILTDDDPVELLEGWLVTKMPKNPSHRLTTQLTCEALSGLIPAGYYVDDQEPLTTDESEPEPDVMIVRGHRRDYRDRHPGPADIALVVEVSDTTLQRDRTLKKQIYARGGIPIYWMINLPEQQIECYTDPSGPAEQPDYQQRRDYPPAEHIPMYIGEQRIGELAVVDLLP
ncbi:MAG: Uma2 family endonuclease [Chloroflexales bacterium]|nr:Uma2 family endonuclease [Chloroflexales bacterium]